MKHFYLSKMLCLAFFVCGYFLSAKAQTTTTFNYTGAIQTYNVPNGILSLSVTVVGAGGGNALDLSQTCHTGGKGSSVTGIIAVTGGQTLLVYAGGLGTTNGSTAFNGGGGGGAGNPSCASIIYGGGGGGASDIRATSALADRLIVAGGGGGSGSGYTNCGALGAGGAGGNADADGAPAYNCGQGYPGGGINNGKKGVLTSTANGGPGDAGGPAGVAGVLGLGGVGANGSYTVAGGGGGGGYYGGGGGGSASSGSGVGGGGAGGGSSYTGGVTGGAITPNVNALAGRVIITELCATPVAGTITGTPAICGNPGTSTTLSTTNAANSADGKWTSSNTAVATVGSSNGVVSAVSAGSTTISFTLNRACGFDATSVPFTVNPVPAIIGNGTVCTANATTLSTSAPGGTWVSSAPAVAIVGSSSGIVSGLLNSNTSTITYTAPTGCQNTLLVTVNTSPSPITGNSSVCTGSTIGLNDFTAGGTWSTSNTSLATVVPTSGLVSGVTAGTVVVYYTLSSGCYSTASLTVNSLPRSVNVTIPGSSQYCAGGSGVHIQLDSSASGVSYQVFNGSLSVGGLVAGNGSGSAFDLGVFPAGTYTVSGTNNITGCRNSMAGSAAITSITLPTLFTASSAGSGSYCQGTTTGVVINLSGSQPSIDNISYQLSYGGNPTGPVLMGTGSSLSFPAQTITGMYRIIATTPVGGCTSTMNGIASIATVPLPAIHMVSGGGGYCPNGTGMPVRLDVSDAGVDYQLKLNGVSVGTSGMLSGTGSGLSFGLRTGLGAYTIEATNQTTQCVSMMSGSPVIYNFTPPAAHTVSLLSGSGSYCPGTPVPHIILSTNSSGISYQLYNNTTASGMSVSGSGSGTLDLGAVPTPGTYTVLGTDPATGCMTTMTGNATITLLPQPLAQVVSGGGNYCNGQNGVHVTLSGSETNASYQLYYNNVLLTGNGDNLTGTGNGLDFGLRTNAGTYTVMGTNTSSGCTLAMNGSTVISVNPLPAVFSVTGGGNYCAGSSGVAVGLNFSSTGVSYQLYRNGSSLGYLPVSGTGGALDMGAQPTGNYTIIATNALTSCTVAMSGSVSINTVLPPSVFPVTGGGSYCAGGTGVRVGLSASNTGVRYALYNGPLPVGSVLTGNGGALDFGLQTAPGTYTIVGNNAATTCSSNMSGSATVVMNAVPVINTVTGGGSICSGSAGIPIGIDMSENNINYQLYKGNTAIGSAAAGNGSSFDFGTYSGSGTYKVTATNPATHCSSNMSGTAVITVNALPLTHTVRGGGSFCAGGSGVDVWLNSSTPGISYELDNGTTPVATMMGTGSSLDFGYQTAGGSYHVVATDPATTCSRDMTAGAVVTVNALPRIDTLMGGGSYCYGGIGVIMTMNASMAGVNYQLYNGVTIASSPLYSTGSPVYFGYIVNPGSYTVKATNVATGCSEWMAGNAPVAVIPYVTPAVTISSDTGYTICEGTQVLYTAAAVNGGVTPAFQWSVNGILMGSNTDTFSYVPANSDRISTTLTSSEACPTSSTVNNTVMMTVYAVGTPSVTVTPNPGATVCAGTSVVFDATPLFGGDAPQYAWSKNGTEDTTQRGVHYTITPANTDQISVRLISNYMCRSMDTVMSTSLTMTVNHAVQPTFTISARPGNIGMGDFDTLRVSGLANGGPTPTFQWYVNGTPVLGQTDSIYISKGLYDKDSVSCTVMSSGVCGGLPQSHALVVRVHGVSVSNVETGMDITMMPNPNKGTFTIQGTSGTETEQLSLEVTNMLGQVVYRGAAAATNGRIDQQVSLGNNLPNGMYLLNIHTASSKNTIHFVIEN